jgi:2-aminophenol/2-amino-5-chlorophenol 1,6-dioxygenase subunit alpha
MSGASVERAYMVPGLPHLVFGNGTWEPLKDALKTAGENARAGKPDVLVIYSGQWISVLGHSFQADPNPKGLHVDENWYDMGDFPYSFKVDVQLATTAAEYAQMVGLATKLVNYEGFPIDTGTLVTLKYFNPDNKIPVMIVSSNIYANAEDSNKLGKAVGEAIRKTGRKAVLINCSGLSYRFHTEEIEAKSDRIASESDDKWNRRVLDLIKEGKLTEVVKISDEYAKSAGPEMMFKGFHWMMGALGDKEVRGNVMAYGPVWGTGAAVVEFQPNG